MNDLTNSAIDRQNILNNSEVVSYLVQHIGTTGMMFENEYKYTPRMVCDYFGITPTTLRTCVAANLAELQQNGYKVVSGKAYKEFLTNFGNLLTIDDDDLAHHLDTDDGQPAAYSSSKPNKAIALFNFRSILNLGMLLTEGERAKDLRSATLDIAIDILNKKLGGTTKYVNQREEPYLVAALREPVYRKEFTDALAKYLDMGAEKYAHYTDAIYNAIFRGNAAEYRAVLKLDKKDKTRSTMYSEILRLIASFEVGIADAMRERKEELGRMLQPNELDTIVAKFAAQRAWQPQIDDARNKMASRDNAFRGAIHEPLKEYITAVSATDYENFLGESSKDLLTRIDESPELLEVFKRLKDR